MKSAIDFQKLNAIFNHINNNKENKMFKKYIEALKNLRLSLRLMLVAEAVALIKFAPNVVVKSYVFVVTLISFYYIFKLAKDFYRTLSESKILN